MVLSLLVSTLYLFSVTSCACLVCLVIASMFMARCCSPVPTSNTNASSPASRFSVLTALVARNTSKDIDIRVKDIKNLRFLDGKSLKS